MNNNINSLYHVHRNGNCDSLWYVGSEIVVDDSFNNFFFLNLLEEDKKLTERYGDYDIDYIISIMEEIKYNNLIDERMYSDFINLLNRYYILRREKALEEGRKLYFPSAPSRIHSIYLTDDKSLVYWKNVVGKDSCKIFLLDLDGNLFVSSDKLFPDSNLFFEKQVELSKEYWKPKVKSLTPREYIFQGKCKIIR